MDRDPTLDKQTLDALLKRGSSEERSTAFEAMEAPEPGRPKGEMLSSIRLKVRAELGRVRLPLKDALQLGPGSVVDLNKLADDPVDLYVNDVLIARGEVLVIKDSFCIRITEVLSQGGLEEEA